MKNQAVQIQALVPMKRGHDYPQEQGTEGFGDGSVFLPANSSYLQPSANVTARSLLVARLTGSARESLPLGEERESESEAEDAGELDVSAARDSLTVAARSVYSSVDRGSVVMVGRRGTLVVPSTSGNWPSDRDGEGALDIATADLPSVQYGRPLIVTMIRAARAKEDALRRARESLPLGEERESGFEVEVSDAGELDVSAARDSLTVAARSVYSSVDRGSVVMVGRRGTLVVPSTSGDWPSGRGGLTSLDIATESVFTSQFTSTGVITARVSSLSPYRKSSLMLGELAREEESA